MPSSTKNNLMLRFRDTPMVKQFVERVRLGRHAILNRAKAKRKNLHRTAQLTQKI